MFYTAVSAKLSEDLIKNLLFAIATKKLYSVIIKVILVHDSLLFVTSSLLYPSRLEAMSPAVPRWR